MSDAPIPRKRARLPVVFPSPTAEEVKTARRIVGISQDHAAAAAGVTSRQWQKYESDEQKMNGRVWINWCFRFDLVRPDL